METSYSTILYWLSNAFGNRQMDSQPVLVTLGYCGLIMCTVVS